MRTNYELALILHKDLLALQRKTRKLRLMHEYELPSVVSNYLPVLLTHLPISSNDISKMMCMTRAEWGGIESLLLQHQIVELENNQNYELLSLGSKASQYIEKSLELDKTIESTLFNNIPDADRNRITSLFAMMNDVLSILPELPLKDESTYIAETKNFARNSGMLGNNYLHSGASIELIQLYTLLKQYGKNSTIDELLKLLPIIEGAGLQMINEQIKQGVIESINLLLLTPFGDQRLQSLDKSCAENLITVVNLLREDGVQEFNRIVSCFVMPHR